MSRAESLRLIRKDLGDCLYRRWYSEALDDIAKEAITSEAVTRSMRVYYNIINRYAAYKGHETPMGNEEGE